MRFKKELIFNYGQIYLQYKLTNYLEVNLLSTTNFEVSGTLEGDKVNTSAVVTLHLKTDLFGSLDVLLENRLGLTTKTGLLSVVSTLTLSIEGSLTGLLLPSNTVESVLLALQAESLLLLREVNLNYVKLCCKCKTNG